MSEPVPTCAYHPGRETYLSCSRCERPICPDCAVNAAVGIRCIGCLSEERGQKPRVARELTAHSRSLRRPGPLFLVLVAAWLGLCGLLWYLSVRPGAPSGTVTEMVLGGAFSDIPNVVKLVGAAATVVGWVVSLCIHEWAHAYVAYKSGDESVVGKGYLTLDPRKYTDPFLSFLLPVIFLLIGGIGLPGGAVWINRAAIRSRGRESLMSAAGPATNILFGMACLAGTHVIGDSAIWLSSALAFLGWLEFLTAALNLLPVPGLDGYGIIDPYLPDDIRRSMWEFARYGMFVIFALVLFTPVGRMLWEFADRGVLAMGVDGVYTAVGELIARPKLL